MEMSNLMHLFSVGDVEELFMVSFHLVPSSTIWFHLV